MSKRKIIDSFWLCYSDLLTSLFFIMLILFIVCIILLRITYGEIESDKDLKQKIVELEQQISVRDSTQLLLEQKIIDYEQILQLENQFKELNSSTALLYSEKHKTFIAKDFIGIEIFKPEESIIKEEYIAKVDRVGNDLETLLKRLHLENPKFNYLLVIEGYSANDGAMNKDRKYNYDLSFERALALYNRWRVDRNIDLRKYNTEILICGSGLNGINRDLKNEANNKRFVIQILPKISKFQIGK